MKLLTSMLFLLGMVSLSEAAPFPETKPRSFSAEVVSFVWIDNTNFEYEGDSFTLGGSEESPRYYILLRNKKLHKKIKEELTWLARHVVVWGLSHPIHHLDLESDQFMIFLPHSKIPRLNVGSTIEFVNYRAWGDEHMVCPKWKSLKIDGKEVRLAERKAKAEQGGAQ